MSNVNQNKRITDILFEHWNEARGERFFPSKDEINEFNLQQSGAWDDVFIVEIYPLVQSNGYRFAYTGKNLGQEFVKDKDGKFIRNIINGFLAHSDDKYNIVAEQKRPLQEERIFKSPETGLTIKYRQILLPLGPNDDAEIDAIIGGMRFIHE